MLLIEFAKSKPIRSGTCQRQSQPLKSISVTQVQHVTTSLGVVLHCTTRWRCQHAHMKHTPSKTLPHQQYQIEPEQHSQAAACKQGAHRCPVQPGVAVTAARSSATNSSLCRQCNCLLCGFGVAVIQITLQHLLPHRHVTGSLRRGRGTTAVSTATPAAAAGTQWHCNCCIRCMVQLCHSMNHMYECRKVP